MVVLCDKCEGEILVKFVRNTQCLSTAALCHSVVLMTVFEIDTVQWRQTVLLI